MPVETPTGTKGLSPMNRSDIVRSAYQRLNDKDFDGALDLCDPAVEFRDLLNKGDRAYGREAVRQRLADRLSDINVHVTVGDVVELGDTVIAAACCRVYDSAGHPVGPYVLVTDHFTFHGDRIIRVDTTEFEEMPDEVRGLLEPGAPHR